MIHHQEPINLAILILNPNLGSAETGNCYTYNIRVRAPPAWAHLWARSGVLTEPAPVQVHRHKHGRYREEVHHRVHLQPEPQLVVGSDELRERFGVTDGRLEGPRVRKFSYPQAEVEQEEDVEAHVDLQREVFVEVLAGLDRTIRGGNKEGLIFTKVS